MTISMTILQQLGGNRFITMTGAKHFGTTGRDLSFKIGSGAKSGINYVNITLDDSDTYTMSFMKLRGTICTEVAARYTVYADDLQRVFTEVTGLDTKL